MTDFNEFCRDFFGICRQSSAYSSQLSQQSSPLDSYDQETKKKALDLAGKCHPATNLIPYLNIVLEARWLGLEVNRLKDPPP